MKTSSLISLTAVLLFATSCASNNNSSNMSADDANIAEESTTEQDEPFPRIDHINGLTIYHITPNIYLSTEPLKDEFVELISSAAFTDAQGRIVGHYYIASYKLPPYGKNPKDRNVTGGFIARPYNGIDDHLWDFYTDNYEAELADAVESNSVVSAFAQNVIIHKGCCQDTKWRKNQECQYRALCEKNGKLQIIESEVSMPYNDFVGALTEQGVYNAVYLNTGTYNYLWYNPNARLTAATTEDKTVEIKSANHAKISNFLNVYIVN